MGNNPLTTGVEGGPRHDEALLIRSAVVTDAAAVAAIYNEGIRGRRGTFEVLERTPKDIAPWFSHAASTDDITHPFLVAERRRGGEAERRESISESSIVSPTPSLTVITVAFHHRYCRGERHRSCRVS